MSSQAKLVKPTVRGRDGDTKFLSYVALDSDAHRFFIRCVLGDSRSSIYPWV